MPTPVNQSFEVWNLPLSLFLSLSLILHPEYVGRQWKNAVKDGIPDVDDRGEEHE